MIDRNRPPPQLAQSIDPPAVDPVRAATIRGTFFDEEKHRKQLELVERRLQWEKQQQIKDRPEQDEEESEYDEDDDDDDDEDDEESEYDEEDEETLRSADAKV
jgi:hypothetical protein